MPTTLDDPTHSATPGVDPQRPLRVVVADDHDRYRTGLVRGLERADGIDVVATAGSGTEALRAALRTEPDVLLLDVHLPVLNAVEVAELLVGHPELLAGAIAISADPESTLAQRFAAETGRPVLDKSASRSAIRAAVLEHAHRPVAA